MRCACGSSDIVAIKPGLDALYLPGGLIPIEHAVADQFTCRACLTKTQRKESAHMPNIIHIEANFPVTDDQREHARHINGLEEATAAYEAAIQKVTGKDVKLRIYVRRHKEPKAD